MLIHEEGKVVIKNLMTAARLAVTGLQAKHPCPTSAAMVEAIGYCCCRFQSLPTETATTVTAQHGQIAANLGLRANLSLERLYQS